MTGVYPRTPGPGRAARRSRSPAIYVVAALVVLAAMAIALVFVVARSAESPARRAIDACQEAVRGQVNDPPAARFSGVSATDNGDGTWDVFGSVSQPGSAGVAESHSFTCTETEQGGDFVVSDSSVF